MSLLVTILIITALILFSAICSGLNISLMALDPSALQRKAKLGNHNAQKVLPLRQKTHLVLASILLTNVAAVSATSIILGNYLNGFVAVIISTLLIVVFGEVIPQAIFAKNPLAWTGAFAGVLKAMVFVAYPISKPLQFLLNKLIGKTPRHLQSRHELGLMISEYLGPAAASELDEDEVEIIRGALQLSEKRVSEILTPINKVYWLTPDTKLTDERVDEIKLKGYSRIPIFNTALTKCYGVILMKELVDIDFDNNVYKVSDMPHHSVKLVGSRTALDTMFRKFISSHTHMIPIERNDKIVGVATIEDLIEEILGHEIEDEIDIQKQRQS